jgi:hypothetical protein
MHKRKIFMVVCFIAIFIMTVTLVGCNLAAPSSQNVNEAVAQTVAAMNTLAAAAPTANQPVNTANPSADTAVPTPMTPPQNTPVSVVHAIMPGEMQAIESTVDDTLYNGDDFNTNLYERPLTSNVMQPRYDLDLQKITMSTDNTFFYFSLNLKDVNIGTKTLDGNYGIELDLDRDGRGDYLLWAYQPPFNTTWTASGIGLFADRNKDVGSTRPLLSDPVTQTDGYETEVWPGKPTLDPDGAWVRVDPNHPTTIQLAVKRSLVGNPSSFLWGAWADDQIKATYKFDYNDFFTAAEAGSLNPASVNYPIKAIAQVDNTCREAWGFTPTGQEPGICKIAVQSTPKPRATQKPGATVGPTKVGITPTFTLPPPVTCINVIVGAKVTPWDVSYTSGVTLCVNGDCKNPDASGYASWSLPAGGYTIIATSSYGITPSSASVKLGCGQKSLSQFVIGPG